MSDPKETNGSQAEPDELMAMWAKAHEQAVAEENKEPLRARLWAILWAPAQAFFLFGYLMVIWIAHGKDAAQQVLAALDGEGEEYELEFIEEDDE